MWRNEQFGAGGVDLLGARLEPEGPSSLGEGGPVPVGLLQPLLTQPSHQLPGSSAGWSLLWSQGQCQLPGLHGHCHQGTGRLLHQVLIPKGQVRGRRLGGTGKEPLTSESGDWKLCFCSLCLQRKTIF